MKRKIFSISLIRAFGCLAVILLHVSVPLIYHSESLSYEWWLGYFFNSITRFSVPIFVMASGALILSILKDEPNINFINFYKKRVSKIMPALIFWNFFYILLQIFQHQLYKFNDMYEFFIPRFIHGNIYYHLWYFYMILGLYVVAPYLAILLKNLKSITLLNYIILGFVLVSCFKLSSYFFENENLFFLVNSIIYIPYFLIGAVIYKSREKLIRYKSIGLFISVISWITLMFLSSFLFTYFNSKLWLIMTDYLNPFVIFMSIGIFIYLINFEDSKSLYFNKMIEIISKFSIGIYLIHPFIMVSYRFIGISALKIGNISGIALTTFLVLFTSIIFCFNLSKIKYLTKTIQT